ncbi:hypothetical protein ACJJTC_010705 [Scirpophaga incertulas]
MFQFLAIVVLSITCSYHRVHAFSLTDEQFAQFPPLAHIDRFSHCVGIPESVYCTSHARIVADGPNKIYDLMTSYIQQSRRHYNYTHIVYGYCITDSCTKHYTGDSPDQLRTASEACINETLSRKYGLKARTLVTDCYKHNEELAVVDDVDMKVAYVFLALLALIVVATSYDLACGLKGEEGLLLCFSFRQNWDQLKAPPTTHPKRSQLVGLNGIRFLTTILVMFGHAPIPLLAFPENPQWVEWAFDNLALRGLFQGHIITLTFFIMSGFLMTYNMQLYRETKKVTWTLLPKAIFLRWCRLIPVNVAVLMLTSTWLRFTNLGPTWQETIGIEATDCRKNWLAHVFYYNNYIDNSTCNIQNWSMAVDMHLHIVGLSIIILAPTTKIRNRLLLAYFVIGSIIPALVIYSRDLEGTFLVTAENIRNYFMTDPTFNYLYKRTHTNVPCFALGMALGYAMYDWHSGIKPLNQTVKKWLGYYTWLLFPLMVLLAFLTDLCFLRDGPPASMLFRQLYSIVQKPVFGVVMSLVIIGVATKVETVSIYRRILEWPLWTPLSRITYSAFSVHVCVIRYLAGTKASLNYLTLPHLMQDYIGVVFLSLLFGFLLYMVVEAPFGQLMKVILSPASKKVKKEHANGSIAHNNEKNSYANGNTVLHNGNGVHSNGNAVYSNGNGVHSNGNGVYSNGNAVYSNGNGVHSNGNGVHSNGAIYTNGKTMKSE